MHTDNMIICTRKEFNLHNGKKKLKTGSNQVSRGIACQKNILKTQLKFLNFNLFWQIDKNLRRVLNLCGFEIRNFVLVQVTILTKVRVSWNLTPNRRFEEFQYCKKYAKSFKQRFERRWTVEIMKSYPELNKTGPAKHMRTREL